jgi:hypothetical protein
MKIKINLSYSATSQGVIKNASNHWKLRERHGTDSSLEPKENNQFC